MAGARLFVLALLLLGTALASSANRPKGTPLEGRKLLVAGDFHPLDLVKVMQDYPGSFSSVVQEAWDRYHDTKLSQDGMKRVLSAVALTQTDEGMHELVNVLKNPALDVNLRRHALETLLKTEGLPAEYAFFEVSNLAFSQEDPLRDEALLLLGKMSSEHPFPAKHLSEFLERQAPAGATMLMDLADDDDVAFVDEAVEPELSDVVTQEALHTREVDLTQYHALSQEARHDIKEVAHTARSAGREIKEAVVVPAGELRNADQETDATVRHAGKRSRSEIWREALRNRQGLRREGSRLTAETEQGERQVRREAAQEVSMFDELNDKAKRARGRRLGRRLEKADERHTSELEEEDEQIAERNRFQRTIDGLHKQEKKEQKALARDAKKSMEAREVARMRRINENLMAELAEKEHTSSAKRKMLRNAKKVAAANRQSDKVMQQQRSAEDEDLHRRLMARFGSAVAKDAARDTDHFEDELEGELSEAATEARRNSRKLADGTKATVRRREDHKEARHRAAREREVQEDLSKQNTIEDEAEHARNVAVRLGAQVRTVQRKAERRQESAQEQLHEMREGGQDLQRLEDTLESEARTAAHAARAATFDNSKLMVKKAREAADMARVSEVKEAEHAASETEKHAADLADTEARDIAATAREEARVEADKFEASQEAEAKTTEAATYRESRDQAKTLNAYEKEQRRVLSKQEVLVSRQTRKDLNAKTEFEQDKIKNTEKRQKRKLDTMKRVTKARLHKVAEAARARMHRSDQQANANTMAEGTGPSEDSEDD